MRPRARFAAVALGSLALFAAAARVHAVPEYWVDNEWIRVTGEERHQEGGHTLLVLTAVCKQQGLPEYIITYLDPQGGVAGEAKSGKYCPGAGEELTFVLPLPESGTWRVEFNRAQGAM